MKISSNYPKKIHDGFTFIELLLVMGLALVFLLGTSSLFYIAVKSSNKAGLNAQAKGLAQEGMESVVAIRDIGGSQWDWSATPVNTVGNEYYQPSLSGTTWVLGNKLSTSPAATMSLPFQPFTRTVKIESVQRAVGCGSAVCPIISTGGIVDNSTRKVTVTVSWQENEGNQTILLASYLTHWK